MGIAAEIGQHLLGAAERGLGVDYPVDAAELAEMTFEALRFEKISELTEELQLAGAEAVLQFPQEQSAEQPREHAHRQEEAGATSDPAAAVERRSAAGNDAMDVRMMLQGLTPGVENHGHAELGAEMPGISRNGGERLGGRAEQDRIDRGLVLERDLADRRRQREDEMEVRGRQQLGLPLREPLGPRQPLAFGTVTIAARVVSDAGCATIIALLDMAPDHRRPARSEGAHDASLDAPEMTGMRLSKRFAVAAEDIRHLQSRSHGTRSAGWHDFQAEPIERARRIADRFGGDPGVARRACEAGVAEQDLDDAHVRPALQKMGRECVPQGVHRHLLAQASRRTG